MRKEKGPDEHLQTLTWGYCIKSPRHVSPKKSSCLLYAQDGHVKNQGRIGWNTLVTLHAIGKSTGNNETADATSFHANQPLIPTLNYTCLAKWSDRKRLSATIIGAIKLFTIARHPACVLNRDSTSLLRYFAAANFEIETLQSIRIRSRCSRCGRRVGWASFRS